MADVAHKGSEAPRVEAASVAALATSADPWRDFLVPKTGANFLAGWLALTAGRLSDCRAAVLLLQGESGVLGFAAGWHLDDTVQTLAGKLAARLAQRPEPLIEKAGQDTLIGYPLEQGGHPVAVAVFVLSRDPGTGLRPLLREIHWAAGWLDARLWQGQAATGIERADSAKLVLDLLAAANEHQRFDGAALALVNAIPEMTGFDTAALGMVQGRGVRLEALSRDAGFTAKARLTRAVEAAMAEAMDQSAPVGFPERPDGRQMITLAHAALARELGAALILSVPLLVEGRAEGVLTVAKSPQPGQSLALDPSAVEDLRLAAAAIGPGLKTRLQERRWISGRGRALAGRAATAVLGRRPTLSLAALAGVAAIAALILVPADLRVHADATLKGATQRSILAPQQGFIAEANVKAGDAVSAGTVLARLDDRELRVQLAAAQARLAKAEQDWRTASAAGKRSEAAIASTALDEANAALSLVEAQLARLTITAPQSGLVISGDLRQRIGAPVSPGDQLFEIASTGQYRLFIDVSEYDLELVRPGQTGQVTFSGLASHSLPFTVATIASVSDPGAGENRFRVEADIDPVEGLRPGLTGTAKIDTGSAWLAWVLLRGTAVRLWFWSWRMLP